MHPRRNKQEQTVVGKDRNTSNTQSASRTQNTFNEKNPGKDNLESRTSSFHEVPRRRSTLEISSDLNPPSKKSQISQINSRTRRLIVPKQNEDDEYSYSLSITTSSENSSVSSEDESEDFETASSDDGSEVVSMTNSKSGIGKDVISRSNLVGTYDLPETVTKRHKIKEIKPRGHDSRITDYFSSDEEEKNISRDSVRKEKDEPLRHHRRRDSENRARKENGKIVHPENIEPSPGENIKPRPYPKNMDDKPVTRTKPDFRKNNRYSDQVKPSYRAEEDAGKPPKSRKSDVVISRIRSNSSIPEKSNSAENLTNNTRNIPRRGTFATKMDKHRKQSSSDSEDPVPKIHADKNWSPSNLQRITPIKFDESPVHSDSEIPAEISHHPIFEEPDRVNDQTAPKKKTNKLFAKIGSITKKKTEVAKEKIAKTTAELKTKVKESRKKSSENPKKKDIVGKRKMFGVPLEETTLDPTLGVPVVIADCFKFLQNSGIEEEGIFRISGSNVLIQDYKDKYDRKDPVDINSIRDPHAVAGLLKLFFRELPIPIFNHPDVIRPPTNSGTPFQRLSQMIACLPELYRKTLSVVADLLNQVSKLSSKNKMTVDNLVIIFGPALRLESDLCKVLILEYEAFFVGSGLDRGLIDEKMENNG